MRLDANRRRAAARSGGWTRRYSDGWLRRDGQHDAGLRRPPPLCALPQGDGEQGRAVVLPPAAGAGGSAATGVGGGDSASVIRAMAQCSVQAARSRASLSASSFWRAACMRSSSLRALCAWRIMLLAWARYFSAPWNDLSGCWASRRHSFHCSEAAT